MMSLTGPVARQSLFVAALCSLLSTTAADDDQVAIVLRSCCIGCHNHVDREGGVSLLSAADIAAGSDEGPLIDDTQPNNSRLLQVLLADSEKRMPPDGEPQPSASERRLLQEWVLNGAPLAVAVAFPDVPNISVRHKAPEPLRCSVRLSETDVVVGTDHGLSRLNAVTGNVVWTIEANAGRVLGLSVSTDGEWIAAACGRPGVDGSAVLVSADDGHMISRFGGHADVAYAAVIDPSRTRLATAGYDRRILVHDIASGEQIQVLTGHNGSVFDLSFDRDGEILCSASGDGTVKVWNTVSGIRLDTLSQPQAEQYQVAVTPDGSRILAAGADNRIREWSLVSRETPRINPLLSSTFGHEQAITCLAISPTGNRVATAAEDGTLRVWDTGPIRSLTAAADPPGSISSLTFLNDQQLLVTHVSGSAKIMQLPELRTPRPSDRPVPPVASVAAPRGTGETADVSEEEPNDEPETATPLSIPVRVSGVIDGIHGTDRDCFRISTQAGQVIVLEVQAARSGSPLDSVVEVLHPNGAPVLRTRLQAVRDSWLTFRGKDSETSDDFRVFYWQEMELNDFLYADGEVVRLWHYPRGPDSGFQVYPGFGARHSWFGTTPTAHALQAPCYVVIPRGPGEEIAEGGLPVFPVYFRNDDDPQRQWGRDSRLFFTAPDDGEWIVRVSDAREFHGPEYSYTLTVRSPEPGFQVSASTKTLQVAPGTGQEVEFSVDRIDGYTGPVQIECHGLPAGFRFSGPVTIEEQQLRAFGTICMTESSATPLETPLAIHFTASARIDGTDVTQKIPGPEELTVVQSPRLRVHVESEDGVPATADRPLELRIRPGETIRAQITLDRLDVDGDISFGKADAGRNLPFGVFVDNIGLNGLLIPAGADRREFFITAAPIVSPQRRSFYLQSSVDGITSLPVELVVLPPADSPSDPLAVNQ